MMKELFKEQAPPAGIFFTLAYFLTFAAVFDWQKQ